MRLLVKTILNVSCQHAGYINHAGMSLNICTVIVFAHWVNSHSNQCSTTGVTKAMVCAIVCGMERIKEPLLLI